MSERIPFLPATRNYSDIFSIIQNKMGENKPLKPKTKRKRVQKKKGRKVRKVVKRKSAKRKKPTKKRKGSVKKKNSRNLFNF